MSSSRKKKTTAVEDEVEELLKAAEDEVFLKLNLNSHMSRVAPSYLQSDLDHRFQSLKKPNKSTPNPNLTQSTSKNSTISQSDQMNVVVDDDHLFARFATLKGTLPSTSSNSVNPIRSDRGVLMEGDDGDDVDKIIQWAIDAARLDPSPDTDDDEADVDDETDETDDDDDDDYGGRVKNHKKSNPKKRK